MPTIRDVYFKAKKDDPNSFLLDSDIKELIMFSSSLSSPIDFALSLDKEIVSLDKFYNGLEKLKKGIPIQYITNISHFYGNDFFVDKRVLIPRNETEELIVLAKKEIIKYFPAGNATLFDIGTGSGCISITLKKAFPNLNVFGSDISQDALDVAIINAKKLNVNVDFLLGNSLEPYIQNRLKANIIVSNPPYIKNVNEVDKNVIENEPHLALFLNDNLNVYKSIFQNYQNACSFPLLMFFEVNYDMFEEVKKWINAYLPKAKLSFIKDINGLNRFVSIIIEKSV